jgi:hypothetical protein
MIKLSRKIGPLYQESQFKDIKDPCPVFDGKLWHIFGSGGSVRDEKWKILHATAPDIHGPWTECDPIVLDGVMGDHVAAPGVIYEENMFHMFVQTDFLATSGIIEYLTADDSCCFKKINTALTSLPGTEEAGIYDPHPFVFKGEKYVVYSGTPRVEEHGVFFISQPDIFLARSESWTGPWTRLGKILDHTHIAWHHNQRDSERYEWGIEGPQLIELPNGKILLNATCFLPEGRFGTRQRVFFATADSPLGPFVSLGPVIGEELEEWESGENGHAAAVVEGNLLHLFYQARSGSNIDDVQANDFRYGIATFDLTPIL